VERFRLGSAGHLHRKNGSKKKEGGTKRKMVAGQPSPVQPPAVVGWEQYFNILWDTHTQGCHLRASTTWENVKLRFSIPIKP
jgi:hypothetical protein